MSPQILWFCNKYLSSRNESLQKLLNECKLFIAWNVNKIVEETQIFCSFLNIINLFNLRKMWKVLQVIQFLIPFTQSLKVILNLVMSTNENHCIHSLDDTQSFKDK